MKNKQKNKKGSASVRRVDSLGFEALAVILINLVCVLILTPAYQGLGEIAGDMSVDVARDGSFLHRLCEIFAAGLFYLSSFLGTAAFFVGAACIVRAATKDSRDRVIGASVILYIGMSVSTIVTLLVFLIVRASSPSVTLAEPMTLLYDVLFLLFRVGAVALGAWFFTRAKAGIRIISLAAAVFMFFCAAGLELVENIPFFLRGTMLTEDVVSLVVSMMLYAVHAVLGYIVMTRLLRR
ncbi:MAG: hypothetical protein IJE84_05165 [Clostridia bacterium]|nr:hypothetical protein [Clostridia bacterium]